MAKLCFWPGSRCCCRVLEFHFARRPSIIGEVSRGLTLSVACSKSACSFSLALPPSRFYRGRQSPPICIESPRQVTTISRASLNVYSRILGLWPPASSINRLPIESDCGGTVSLCCNRNRKWANGCRNLQPPKTRQAELGKLILLIAIYGVGRPACGSMPLSCSQRCPRPRERRRFERSSPKILFQSAVDGVLQR